MMNCHRLDFCSDAFTVLSRVPRGMTGRICRKSPQKRVAMPPIGQSLQVMSLRVRSTASKASRCVIGASSTIMAWQSLITLASAVPLLIAHMSTRVTLSGILKVECSIRPPVSSVAAIPLDAVARAMCPCDRTVDKMRFMRKVLPVPLGTSTKTIPPWPPSTKDIIWYRWSTGLL